MAKDSTKNIHTIIRKEVVEVVREVLSDPDADLNLSPQAIRRLKKSVGEVRKGNTTSLSKIFKQYGT